MIKLTNLLKEITQTHTLTMIAIFTDKNGDWHNEDWFFDPSIETQGLISKYGKGANGQSWKKPSILCTEYQEDDPFDGFHEYWKWAVIFKKNINEIFLDDEIFYYGEYPSKEMETQALNFIKNNYSTPKNISLGILKDKFKVKITQDNFPYGNYVLDIKPDEIIKISKK